ncbi:MAG: mechanosensitive ion channel, partial [Cyclobacteriaceae bacterium]
VFVYSAFFAVLRKYFSVWWKWVRVFNYILGGSAIAGILLILSSRHTLGKIMINGAGESIAIAYILIFLATWFDKLIDFVRDRPRFRSLSSNREKLEEFWLQWHNRIYTILLILFIISILRNFNIQNNVQALVMNFFSEERTIGDLTYTVGGIALFILMIYLSTKISGTIQFLSEDKSFYRSQKRTANLSVILRFFVITLGFLLALIVSGIPMDKITIILGALSVGIGFGLQNIVNNLISGLILIFERPIQSGDIVEVQQFRGVVKDIGIRSSVIRRSTIKY